MKISIITITRNDGALLAKAIDSVALQQLPEGCELEHVIVASDSDNSNAHVYDFARSIGAKVIHVPSKGCYNALNIGIDAATGDVIGLVHGTDFFRSPMSLRRMAQPFLSDPRLDFAYGDIEYVQPGKPDKSVRNYRGSENAIELIRKGIAPPHPSLFIKSDVLKRVGAYKEEYKVAADFEFFVRLLNRGEHEKFNYRYVPGVNVCMHTGGMSSTIFNRLIRNNLEKRKALRDNGINISWAKLLTRYFHFLKKSAK